MHAQERRRTSRFPSTSKGYAILNGIDLDMRAHDISPMGALVEFASHYSIREGTRLRIHIDACLIRMAVVCRIVTVNSRTLFALKFENTLPETASAIH